MVTGEKLFFLQFFSVEFLRSGCFLSARAVDFNYFTNFWNVHELVNQSLAVHLGQNASLIVVPKKINKINFWILPPFSDSVRLKMFYVPQCTAHSFIVHIWFVLVQSPKPGHGFGVGQLEDSLLPVSPLDAFRAWVFILEQLEQELPQVGRGAFAGFSLHRDAIRANLWLPGLFLQLFQWSL